MHVHFAGFLAFVPLLFDDAAAPPPLGDGGYLLLFFFLPTRAGEYELCLFALLLLPAAA